MQTQALHFPLSPASYATVPPEARGRSRDSVKLLVSHRGSGRHEHARFRDMPRFLSRGDVLVVNRSGTIPAALPAVLNHQPIRVHLSTDLRDGHWIVEPRTATGAPWTRNLTPGDVIRVQGHPAAMLVVARYKTFARLWLVRTRGDLTEAAWSVGSPIRYGYVREPWPLSYYQTVFANAPGSVEMPSAGRPFTHRLIRTLQRHGINLVGIVLHTGVSSHEVTTERVADHPMYPEWYHVPPSTAATITKAQRDGRRVIAVGSTVVRALETVSDEHGRVLAGSGFTEAFVHPDNPPRAVNGLITGLHAPVTSHLAMLAAFGFERLHDPYAEAVARGYLWHEFGDAHFIL